MGSQAALLAFILGNRVLGHLYSNPCIKERDSPDTNNKNIIQASHTSHYLDFQAHSRSNLIYMDSHM